MQLKTLSYTPVSGWSEPLPTQMDSAQTLILAFGASEYADTPEQIESLLVNFPEALTLGCSTSGEIFGAEVNDGSLSVAIVRFESTPMRQVEAVIEANSDSNDISEAAGRSLGLALAAEDLRAVFLVSDGLHVNGSDLVKGINSQVAEHVVVTGGLAGDRERFKQTWVLSKRQLVSHRVTAIGFYGDAVRIGHGSQGGWDIFGPERKVTRSRGNVLYELDGQPALALYKKYLGELADQLPGSALRFPLALRETRESDNPLVRTILAVDEDRQSMTFAGDIPLGWQAQLMRANFNDLVEGAEQAASATRLGADWGDEPILVIAISCVGRRMVLGSRAEDETEATLELLPAMAQQIGFYSYGELSPHNNGRCELHNQTMTLTAFSER